MNQSKEMARIAWQALSDKKGEDIKIIDITGVSVLADYFIIASGNSESQISALVDNVEEELHKAGYHLKQREGRSGASCARKSAKVIVCSFGRFYRILFIIPRFCSAGKRQRLTGRHFFDTINGLLSM